MERGRGQEASGDIDWRGRRWRKKREERKKKVRENEREKGGKRRERGESWVKEEALYHITGEKISVDFEVL